MENASKALIIAGAILLSILLISLGLMVYNQAKDTIGSVNLSQQEIEAFNSKFTSYEGSNVSGSQVNALIQTVMASNQQAINDSTGAYVIIRFNSITDNKMVISGVSADDKIGYSDTSVLSSGFDVNALVSHHKSSWGKHKLDENGGFKSSITSSLKVNTGLKYTVNLGYEDGRVAGIWVE